MLMPSMVTTDRDKMGTALLQLEPSHLLFARLHFKVLSLLFFLASHTSL
jgi:hypothetical protein